MMQTITVEDVDMVEGNKLAAVRSSPVGVIVGHYDYFKYRDADEQARVRERIQHIVFEHLSIVLLDPVSLIRGSLHDKANYVLQSAFDGVVARCDFYVLVGSRAKVVAVPAVIPVHANIDTLGLTRIEFPGYGDLGLPSNPWVMTGTEQAFLNVLAEWAATWRRPKRGFHGIRNGARHVVINGTGFDSPTFSGGDEASPGDSPMSMGEPVENLKKPVNAERIG